MSTPSVNNTYVFPSLAEFLSRRMRDISARINCHLIGTINSFNSTEQTAVVSVNFLKTLNAVNPLGDTGESSDEVISYPLLVEVPVIILQGGGGVLTFPITKGDICLLLFCDRDMDSWFNAGLTAIPNSDRVHDINDAICLVGLNNLQTPITSYDGTNVKLNFGGGYLTISPTGVITILKGSGSIVVDASNNITISGGTVTITGSTQVAINP